MTTAIILAGGGGVRLGGPTPKQFVDLLGRPVLAFTLDAFHRAATVDEVIVVCHQGWIDFVREMCRREGFTRVTSIIEGGATRQASSRVGVTEAAARGARRVLVHDAARPLVTPEVIDEASRRIVETGVVDVVAKTTDTIVRSVDGLVRDIPERAHLYNGQTPQGFRIDIALACHERAAADGIDNATDDVQLALRVGYSAVIVDGGPHNIKITHPQDLEIARLLLERKLGRSHVVRLTGPFAFEDTEVLHRPDAGRVAVRPLLGSICAADLRYYAGRRSPEALRRKLPMALLHEGVGEVVFSPLPELPAGARVVIVPHVKRCDDPACRACADRRVGENHCPRNGFMASGEDGLAQTLLQLDARNVIRIPDEVPTDVAVMTELLSISVGAMRRLGDATRGDVCVVGGGPLGYATQIIVSEMTGLSALLVGRDEPVAGADLYVEAAGGSGSAVVLRDIITAARPGATIVLLGVSEEPVPIDTRRILEKGLRLVGCSRSMTDDHATVLQLLRRPHVAAKVEKLLIRRSFQLSRVREAFDFALERSAWGKVLVDLTA